MSQTSRRIDHVVVAVRDLDAAGNLYQRLGFQVGARNRHPWGTENRLIQFSSSFIELITVGSRADAVPDPEADQFSIGAFIRNYLSQREGLAMLALDSANATADAALFSRMSIGALKPFYFRRNGRRPDGSETHVAFTLAFAVAPQSPQAGFFVCQHHFPENFWDPAFRHHENAASAITKVRMIAEHPEAYRDFLSAFSGSPARLDDRRQLSMDLQGGRLSVVAAPGGSGSLRLDSLVIGLSDLATQVDRLRRSGIPFTATNEGLRIPPDAAFGLTLVFEQGAASA